MRTTQTASNALIKKINKSIVFETIKLKGPISRAEIAKQRGLNKATVSKMVTELIKESFIKEIGEGQSSGGRKPIMLHFNQNAGYSIGIDLGVNYITGILTDLNGNIVERTQVNLCSTNFLKVLRSINKVIETLKNNSPLSPYGIVGIGIGVPGQINQNGDILFAPNLNWRHINLKEKIEKKHLIPVEIVNEANAGAHGEHILGVGRNIKNQIYISIGIGIGTGIIINHNLYEGSFGTSGEMGHFSINVEGRKCPCGSKGCWELYASEGALLDSALKTNIIDNKQSFDLNVLLAEARMGNSAVLKILEELGENIGYGLVNIINTFDPEIITIGNRIVQFQHWIAPPITKVVQERVSNYSKLNTGIRFSILKDNAVTLGVNLFTISSFFKKHQLQFTYPS